MKKLLIGLTLLTSMSSFADIGENNIERWNAMRSNGELTEQGYEKLVKKQSILDNGEATQEEALSIEDLEEKFKASLDQGDITPLGYSKLIMKLDSLKSL